MIWGFQELDRLNGIPKSFGHAQAAMSSNIQSSPESLEQVAERLRFLRTRDAASQAEFARKHRIQSNTWNNYERAVSRIRVDEAIKMRRAYGVTLDWIYLGLEPMMPAHLIDEWRAWQDKDQSG